VFFAGLIEQGGKCKDVLDRVAEGVVLVDVATEIEGKVKEVFHVMGEEVPADVFAVLELFVEEADAELKFALFVFGHKDDNGLGH
jgi:hypothetical protein